MLQLTTAALYVSCGCSQAGQVPDGREVSTGHPRSLALNLKFAVAGGQRAETLTLSCVWSWADRVREAGLRAAKQVGKWAALWSAWSVGGDRRTDRSVVAVLQLETSRWEDVEGFVQELMGGRGWEGLELVLKPVRSAGEGPGSHVSLHLCVARRRAGADGW